MLRNKICTQTQMEFFMKRIILISLFLAISTSALAVDFDDEFSGPQPPEIAQPQSQSSQESQEVSKEVPKTTGSDDPDEFETNETVIHDLSSDAQ